MRFLPKLPALALAALLLTHCTGPAETATATDPAAAAEAAVMNQHDSLMARTGELFELKQRIQNSQADPATGAVYVRGLQRANDLMMGWMHQYHAPDSAAPAAQRLAYFETQQQQLATVDARMRGTIDSARAFLQALPESQVGGGQ